MSVAFTKEEDSESAAADLPDRPISPHPNLVTAKGLSQLDEELAKARETAPYAGEADPYKHPEETAEDPESDGWDDDDDWDDDDEA